MQKSSLLRVVENQDWVIYSLLGLLLLFIILLRFLNKGISLWEFLLAKEEESSNIFANWALIGLGFVLSLSVFLSSYVPIVPPVIRQFFTLGDYSINKFGFTLLLFSGFFLLKAALSYLFMKSTMQRTRWHGFMHVASKFFVLLTLVLVVVIVYHFFYIDQRVSSYRYYLYGMVFALVAEIGYLTFHPKKILPGKWYYKILYLCTLQIIPYLVVFKILFVGL